MILATVDIFSSSTFYDQTTLHPLGLAAMGLFGLAMIVLPRRLAIVPMLAAACFIAPAQRVVVFTLDFNMLRLMVVFGWLRVLMRRETVGFTWRSLDVAVVAWAACGSLAMTLLYMTAQILIYRLGFMYDALGLYFLFRCLVREWRDVETIAISAAWLSVPLAGAFLLEMNTGRNLFSILGGVPAYTMIRNGSLRCQGAFAHPILAGAFWATLLPLLGALMLRPGWRRGLALVGIACAAIIIFASASSTPMMAAFVAVAAMAMFPLRRWMGFLRLATLVLLMLMQIVMNNPVWHLLTRIDLAGGSTGWYRYKLIDDFIRHIGDWWLIGTKSTAVWRQWGSNDITNQYVLEGVTGGLLTLILFIAVIALAFRAAGRFEPPHMAGRSRTARHIQGWALGCALFVHVVVFIGVSYFGQMQMLWYLTLAMIGSLSPASRTVRLIAVACRPAPPAAETARPADPPDMTEPRGPFVFPGAHS